MFDILRPKSLLKPGNNKSNKSDLSLGYNQNHQSLKSESTTSQGKELAIPNECPISPMS